MVAGVVYTSSPRPSGSSTAPATKSAARLAAARAATCASRRPSRRPMTGARVKPVVLSSIVAPQPGSGQLAQRDGQERCRAAVVKHVRVQAIGPTTETKTTNDAGLRRLRRARRRQLHGQARPRGWVDQEGAPDAEQDDTVTAGSLSTVEFVYDRASSASRATKRPEPAPRSRGRCDGVTALDAGCRPASLLPRRQSRPSTCGTLPAPAGEHRLQPVQSPGCSPSRTPTRSSAAAAWATTRPKLVGAARTSTRTAAASSSPRSDGRQRQVYEPPRTSRSRDAARGRAGRDRVRLPDGDDSAPAAHPLGTTHAAAASSRTRACPSATTRSARSTGPAAQTTWPRRPDAPEPQPERR